MKILALLAALVVALTLGVAPAFGHAHGITPLLQCSVDDPNSGGTATDDTPAAGADGGPLGSGLFAADPGQSSLGPTDGGFGATGDNCP
jgi:hypothetical protein